MRLLPGLAWVAAWLATTVAAAHIVMGGKTLRQLTAEADLVLRARVVASGERVGISSEAGGTSRPVVEAEALEVLAGAFDAPRVRFAQHGHGVATFSPGEEVLLFLRRIERSRELRGMAETGAVEWVSLQEHEEEHPLLPETREPRLAAVRAYAAASRADGEARDDSLRAATRALLLSGDDDLAASAVRDLVLAPDAPLLAAADAPRYEALLADPDASLGVRAALLVELERRGIVESRGFWMDWLSDAAPQADRVGALRASRATRDPVVRARVRVLVGDPDPDVAAAAALAVGADPEAVGALTRALGRPEQPVRYAAIRALGHMALPEAREALAGAAAEHPDTATRRRARAELDKSR